MKIKKLEIENYRVFGDEEPFVVDSINIPNGEDGSGLTVFVGENGCGKTSLLDAIALTLISYKPDSFSITDFNSPENTTSILLYSENKFDVKGTMPKSADFPAIGFEFKANVRKQDNKRYLSSIIASDQRFIKAAGQEKPSDSSPDLRVTVNNPFSGPRFAENDVLFLDKNRLFQTRSGNFNPTRFDRLMDDFNFHYISSRIKVKAAIAKSQGKEESLFDDEEFGKDEIVQNLSELVEQQLNEKHEFLEVAIDKFQEVCGVKIELNFLNNWKPYSSAFFSVPQKNNLQLNIGALGSGYEMLFALIYSYYLSNQSDKELIVLIDEPELHLHPKLQEKLVELLTQFSSKIQIIITTHSSLLIKQLLRCDAVGVRILRKENGKVNLKQIGDRVLPTITASEVNYLAFDLCTEEFHNELYGHLQERTGKFHTSALDDWLKQNKLEVNRTWKQLLKNGDCKPVNVSLQTYIRHYFHHPENLNNAKYSQEEIETSCREMIDLLEKGVESQTD